jgi:hypothetical protein
MKQRVPPTGCAGVPQPGGVTMQPTVTWLRPLASRDATAALAGIDPAHHPDFREGAAGRLGAQGLAPRHQFTHSRRGVLLRRGARLTLRDS